MATQYPEEQIQKWLKFAKEDLEVAKISLKLIL